MISNTYGMKWSLLIAHQMGSCVVATYTREVAETKAA